MADSPSLPAAESRDELLARKLDEQRWRCVECREDILTGEEIARIDARGFAHFSCIQTYYAPERSDG